MLSAPAGDDHRAGAHRVRLAGGVGVLDAGRLRALDQDAVDGGVRAQLEQAARPRVVDVGVHASTCRRSSGSPGGTSRSACSWRRCTTGRARARRRARGSPPRPYGRSCASRSARARRAPARPGRSTGRGRPAVNGSPRSFVRPVAACHFATSRSCARSATFVLIVVVPPTQRPARNASISPPAQWREPERPEEIVWSPSPPSG